MPHQSRKIALKYETKRYTDSLDMNIVSVLLYHLCHKLSLCRFRIYNTMHYFEKFVYTHFEGSSSNVNNTKATS